MNLKSIIKIFYLVFTIYVLMLVNTTNLTIYSLLPSILLMWITYFVFIAGYSYKNSNKKQMENVKTEKGLLLNYNSITLMLIALSSIIFSILVVNYYTGQTPISVINNLKNNVSLYYEYQTHFREQQISAFSITKLPFIFMLFYIKILLFYSYVSFLIIKKKLTKVEKLYLGIITLSFVYVGIARGTNFEFFELLILVIFTLLSRRNNAKLPVKELTKAFLLGCLMIFVFYNGISSRGVQFDYYISRDVYYDPSGIIPSISPFLSFITLIIYDYLGFGFFYISKYVSELWFASGAHFFAGLLPFGFHAFDGIKIQEQMIGIVDFGVRWHPDFAIITNSIGYFGFLILFFLLGVFAKYIQLNHNGNTITLLTTFLILLQMIAIPIGNFVFVASSSKIIVFLVVVYWIWKTFIALKIKL